VQTKKKNTKKQEGIQLFSDGNPSFQERNQPILSCCGIHSHHRCTISDICGHAISAANTHTILTGHCLTFPADRTHPIHTGFSTTIPVCLNFTLLAGWSGTILVGLSSTISKVLSNEPSFPKPRSSKPGSPEHTLSEQSPHESGCGDEPIRWDN
jgi:hypothetical protein